MRSPILLIAADTKSFPTGVLRRKLNIPIVLVSNRRAALAALRKQEFGLVVVGDLKPSGDCIGTELLTQNAGEAPVVEIHLEGTEISSIARQVHSAFNRAVRERERARRAAIAALQGELRDSLSGLLLESQLALHECGSTSHPKLANLVFLVGQLSERLKLPFESGYAGLFTQSG